MLDLPGKGRSGLAGIARTGIARTGMGACLSFDSVPEPEAGCAARRTSWYRGVSHVDADRCGALGDAFRE